jgi:uncharacterized protein YqgC (DUF456 family)
MKKTLRRLSASIFVASVAAALLVAAPASALTMLGNVGTTLPAIPGIETLALGLIGLACLAFARQRANP